MKRLFSRGSKKDKGLPNIEVSKDQEDSDVVPAEAPKPGTSPKTASSAVQKGDAGVSVYKMLMSEREMKKSLKEGDGVSAITVPNESQPSTSSTPTKHAIGTEGAVNDVKTKQSKKVKQKRLMKELKDIKKNEMKETNFAVDLVDDNLFEWDVWLRGFDPDSDIAKDLANLKKETGVGDLWLRMSFPGNFPFDPPFLRVLAPLVEGGFVLSGGAICMELLTPDGWSTAYTVEAIIMQTIATLVKGKARIVGRTARPYGEQQAKASYDFLVKTHAKHGWNTPAKADG
eukprot:m.99376 g.99376  ORF g.99376 m.99376 type:complete len:286 (-) comp27152_c0_seq1:97-954(-)